MGPQITLWDKLRLKDRPRDTGSGRIGYETIGSGMDSEITGSEICHVNTGSRID
jgi:hypothetical protein